MTARIGSGVPHCMINPKYLHSNSTSHAGPFSAIAELIDNAYDPDVRAKQIWIDAPMLRGQQVLSFMDNGNGLKFETMHRMLSFGYSDKSSVKGIKPIGMYGNGFKSGAMRLGRDAIVFSKSESTSCVGMLSQTYLEDIRADHIVVPIVCFEQSETNELKVGEDQQASLEAILQYSPFRTQEELLQEISVITSLQSTTKTGTRIIIWNLRRTSTDTTELDIKKDPYDIQFPLDVSESLDDEQPGEVSEHIPESSYSLRAYCSILYLKPRMQIVLRGLKVTTQFISRSLALTKKDSYRPTFQNKKIPITFGYNTKSKHQYGVMMYHKNRLIRAYERVGCQLKANYEGVGVIGIIECGDFLEPTHNKQSFNETDKYRKTMKNLGEKINDYWKEIRHSRKQQDPRNTTPVEDTVERPDQNWVQCDECLKWRKVPDGFEVEPSEKWTCSLNSDPEFRSCEVEEDPEASDDGQTGYTKTYKRQNKLDQKNQRETKQETPSNTPSSHTTTVNTESPQGGAAYKLRSSILLQADCSSPGSSGPRVNVSSPSTTPLRGKRTKSAPHQTTPKRQKVQSRSQGMDVVKRRPLLMRDDEDDDDDDDDVSIIPTVNPKGVEEEEAQDQTEKLDRAEQSTLKMRDEDQSQDVDLETHHQDEEDAGPSYVYACEKNSTQVHSPDQHSEIIQSSTDHFKDQVEELTSQLQNMQHELQQLEETEDGRYRSLFEEVKQKFDELIGLLKTIQIQRSTARAEESDLDDSSIDGPLSFAEASTQH